jgi:flavin reductase (DIM6/NTAB) family NADH-FMN oxidoreductase RutF
MSIEKDLFRRVMGSFASGVTVVTVKADDGQEPTGFTANAVSSLSIEPRMLLVCVNDRSSTLALIEQAGYFVVNILSARQQEIAQQFATRRDNRFEGIRWRPGHETGAPVLDGSLAYAECKLTGTARGGDHVILMGEILAGDANEAEPLLYFRGRYGTYDAVVSPVIHPADIWEIW